MHMEDMPVFFPFIFIVFGLFFSVIGFKLVMDYINLKKYCTELINATVTAYEITKRRASKSRRMITYYTPIVSYSVKGTKYTGSSKVGNTSRHFAEGDELELAYNPNDPKQFYLVKDKATHNAGGIICTFVGLCVTFAGFFLLWVFFNQ